MRILFLNPSGHLGGAERCLLDLIASIRAHEPATGAELGLVAGGDGQLLSEAEAMGVRVIRLPLTARLAAAGDSTLRAPGPRAAVDFVGRLVSAGVDAPQYAHRLMRAARQFQPTVIHSNGIKMHLLASALALGAPVVWHVRDFLGDRPFISHALRSVAWRSNAAIAISQAVADDVRRIMPGLRTAVVHDAIDTDVFAPSGKVADLDALAGCAREPEGTVRVGLVATYARWKGHELFLDAARRVVSSPGDHRVRFYIVGGPIYDAAAWQYGEAELRGMVNDMGLEAWVKFIPFQNRVDAVFRALDVVVHASSKREPFGRTIAEAMATGRAVIASRESGAAELFDDGTEALGFRLGDAGALAAAIVNLVADSSRRDMMGSAARSAAVERFARARLAKQILHAYADAGIRVHRCHERTAP